MGHHWYPLGALQKEDGPTVTRERKSTQVSTAELWKKAFAGLGMSDCRAIPEDAPSKTQLGGHWGWPYCFFVTRRINIVK